MARFNRMVLRTNPLWSAATAGYVLKLFNLNSTINKVYWIFQAQEQVTISHLGFRYNKRVGTPPTYRLSLRQVDGIGEPSSTMLTSGVFTPPANSSIDNTFQWIEMLSTYKASRGEKLCGVIEHNSGPVNVSHFSQISNAIANASTQRGWFPYSITVNAVGEATRDPSQIIFGWKSMSRSYGWPIETIALASVNSPAQTGLRFQLNRGYGRVFKLAGARFQGRQTLVAGKSFDMVLYDENLNELSRVAQDADHSQNTAVTDCTSLLLFDDADLPSLNFGATYFLVFSPNEADTNFALRTVEVPDALDMTAFRGATQFFGITRAIASGAFAEHDTIRPQMDLLISEWTE